MSDAPTAAEKPSPIERLYDVKEAANFLRLSKDTTRRLFAKEPGIFTITTPPCKYRRKYVTMRIPESVLLRVYRRGLTVAA
jgi:hypothetical protein